MAKLGIFFTYLKGKVRFQELWALNFFQSEKQSSEHQLQVTQQETFLLLY